MEEFEVGNTIRIRGRFTDWAPEGELGLPIDPTEVSVNIYDAEWVKVASDLTPVNEAVGTYYYDWTIPAEGSYFAEMVGLINEKPQLSRVKFKAKLDVK